MPLTHYNRPDNQRVEENLFHRALIRELGDSGWRVQVEGDTPMDVNISFPRSGENYADQLSGLTSHPAVNAVPYVCKAAPGIVTNAGLPVIAPIIG